MNIAICDDNAAFAKILQSKIMDYFAKIDKPCSIKQYLSPQSLLCSDLSSLQVLFLDIDMPEMSGLDVARAIRANHPDIYLVFVTAWIEYAPDGYRVNAFRYLLKQRLDTELDSCLDDIREKMNQGSECIQLPSKDFTYDVRVDDIIYIEGSARRMVLVHTVSEQVIECKGKLAEFEDLLVSKGFLRIQKSFIVNMRHLSHIKGYSAYLRNGTTLKTTERDYAAICDKFLLWKGAQL